MANSKEEQEMSKVLVIGATGQLGSALMDRLEGKFDLVGTYHFNKRNDYVQIDIRNREKTIETIKNIKPRVIILTASFTHVDNCEIMRHIADEMNVKGVKNICAAAKTINAKLVFISSIYVFNGKKDMYSEKDKTNPLNYYGKTKLIGEEEVSKLDDYLIIRTSKIFTKLYDDRNFVARLIQSLSNKEPVNVTSEQYTNPVTATYLSELIGLLIEKKKKGIFHVGGKQYLSIYSFAKKVARQFKLNSNLIKPIKDIKYRQIAPRPLKVGLKTDKIEKALGIRIKSFAVMIKEMKGDIKSSGKKASKKSTKTIKKTPSNTKLKTAKTPETKKPKTRKVIKKKKAVKKKPKTSIVKKKLSSKKKTVKKVPVKKTKATAKKTSKATKKKAAKISK